MREYVSLCLVFVFGLRYSSGTLVDGIVTLSWSSGEASSLVARFLDSGARIQLKIRCHDFAANQTLSAEQQKKKEDFKGKIQVTGRIGRVLRCLPVEYDSVLPENQVKSKDRKNAADLSQQTYDDLWNKMEQKSFQASADSCDDLQELTIESYSDLNKAVVPPEPIGKDPSTLGKQPVLTGTPTNSSERRETLFAT